MSVEAENLPEPSEAPSSRSDVSIYVNPSWRSEGVQTLRSLLVGGFVGVIACATNIYFGLKTGISFGMHIHGAILTYALLSSAHRLPMNLANNFGPLENCFAQTVVVGVGSAAVAGGFVGPLLALQLNTQYFPKLISLSSGDILGYAVPVALVGVALALLIRTLSFKAHSYPSGTVAARLLSALHAANIRTRTVMSDDFGTPTGTTPPNVDSRVLSRMSSFHTPNEGEPQALSSLAMQEQQQLLQSRLESIIRAEASPATRMAFSRMFQATILGVVWRLVTYFVPILESLPLLHWSGLNMYRIGDFGWSLYLSPAFWGYGMIVGKGVILSQLAGAIVGYVLLGPATAHLGWAQASLIGTHDIEAGPYAFILFSAVTVMMTSGAAALLRHVWSVATQGTPFWHPTSEKKIEEELGSSRDGHEDEDDYGEDGGIGTAVGWGAALWMVTSTAVIIVLYKVFLVNPLASLSVLVLGSALAVACVRVLAVTDRNVYIIVAVAVQALLGMLLPGDQVLHIALSGAAAAIAFQAGECIQGYRTGHLLKVPWRAQFHAQVIGGLGSVFLTVALMELFQKAFVIPGPEFPAVEAFVYRGFSHLTSRGFEGLPEHLPKVVAGFACFTWVVESIQNFANWHHINMIAFGMGMYLDPFFTVAPCAGYLCYNILFDNEYKIMTGAGLITGEVLMTVVVAVFTLLAVPQLTCAGCGDICCGGPCCSVLSCC